MIQMLLRGRVLVLAFLCPTMLLAQATAPTSAKASTSKATTGQSSNAQTSSSQQNLPAAPSPAPQEPSLQNLGFTPQQLRPNPQLQA